MNIPLMRFLDRWLAGLVCALATPLAWILRCVTRSGARAPLRRVLCLKFFGLGSLTRAAPLFSAIRRSHPTATLSIITFSENAQLLERMNVFDRIVTIDTRSITRTAVDLLKCVRHLAFTSYDAVIDMEFFSNFSTLLAFLTNAPIRAGFYLRRSIRERFLTQVVYYNSFQHISDAYLALGRAVGASGPPEPSGTVWVQESDRERLRELLRAKGIGGDEAIVVININASELCFERRWPPDHFARVCRGILAESKVRLAFIGAGSQREYVQAAVDQIAPDPCINLAGETDFGMLLALLERAALLVGNDSGPVHLAEVIGTPIVALYGPESPLHYGLKRSRTVSFYLGLYCSPCLNALNVKLAPCGGNNVCMKYLPPDDVLQASLLLLRGQSPSREEVERWAGYGGRFASCDWLHPPDGAPDSTVAAGK